MHKYYNQLLLVLFLMLSTGMTFAQRRTFSPYSRYGIGELAKPGMARNIAMGGTGIALQSSNYLNSLNPASYSAMDTMSLYFEAGVSAFSQNLKSAVGSTNQSNSNFDYFAIGLPISKRVKSSFGMQPYAFTGYNIKNTQPTGDISTSLGSGNFSKVYLGLSVEPFKNFSLGAHASYLFGKQQHTNYFTSLIDPQALSYGIIRDTHISDITFDFGAQYLYDINQKHRLTFGVVFSPKASLNGDMKELKARGISFNENTSSFDQQYAIDTINYKQQDFNGNELQIPLSYGAGVAYHFDNKIMVTADFQLSQWAEVNMPAYALSTDAAKTVSLENSTRISFGAEYMPDDRLATSYFSRLRYRVGTYQYRDYISYNGKNIDEIGLSVGVGFPMKRDESSVKLSFVWGKKGSTQNNMIRESFARFTLDITMFEYWFIKRKFD